MKLSTLDLIVVVLLAATVLFSTHAVTGDGAEYVLMAERLAHGRAPAIDVDQARQAEMFDERLINRQGRQEMWHFWVFPLLAAPLAGVTSRMGAPTTLAFGLLNATLLAVLFVRLRRRYGPAVAVFFCVSPIVWWIDKAQVEVFTYTWLMFGCLVIPRLSVAAICFAIAATQNPPIALLIGLLWLTGVAPLPRGRRDWLILAVAMAVLGLHPIYYWLHLGRPTPLVETSGLIIPGLRTLLTPLADLNLGVLPGAPIFVTAASVLVARSAAARGKARRLAFVLGAEAVFLFAFAQAPNINSGGTPGMTRYALWLMPPLVTLADGGLPGGAPQIPTLLVALSAVWSVLLFNPFLPEESYLQPSRLAAFVWSRYPQLENPLPEIFAERLRHEDGVNLIASTPDCAKALIQEGRWPDPCSSAEPVPDACRGDDALCYANRRGDGTYAFVPTSRRGGTHLTGLLPWAPR